MSAGDSKEESKKVVHIERKRLYELKIGFEWHCDNSDDFRSWAEFTARSVSNYGEKCKVFAWRWIPNDDAEVGVDPDHPPLWSGKDVLILAVNSEKILSNLVDAEIGVGKEDEPAIHEWLKAHLIHTALAE